MISWMSTIVIDGRNHFTPTHIIRQKTEPKINCKNSDATESSYEFISAFRSESGYFRFYAITLHIFYSKELSDFTFHFWHTLKTRAFLPEPMHPLLPNSCAIFGWRDELCYSFRFVVSLPLHSRETNKQKLVLFAFHLFWHSCNCFLVALHSWITEAIVKFQKRTICYYVLKNLLVRSNRWLGISRTTCKCVGYFRAEQCQQIFSRIYYIHLDGRQFWNKERLSSSFVCSIRYEILTGNFQSDGEKNPIENCNRIGLFVFRWCFVGHRHITISMIAPTRFAKGNHSVVANDRLLANTRMAAKILVVNSIELKPLTRETDFLLSFYSEWLGSVLPTMWNMEHNNESVRQMKYTSDFRTIQLIWI